MKTKNARFIKLPSWALSVLAVILISVIVGIFNSQVRSIDDNYRYMIWAALTIIACFFICWNSPKDFWYVPLICNVFTPFAAIMDDTFWTTPFWIIMIIGFCLSYVAGFIGTKIGQKAEKLGTIQEES